MKREYRKEYFRSMSELVEFLNTYEILKEDIVNILELRNNGLVLIFLGED